MKKHWSESYNANFRKQVICLKCMPWAATFHDNLSLCSYHVHPQTVLTQSLMNVRAPPLTTLHKQQLNYFAHDKITINQVLQFPKPHLMECQLQFPWDLHNWVSSQVDKWDCLGPTSQPSRQWACLWPVCARQLGNEPAQDLLIYQPSRQRVSLRSWSGFNETKSKPFSKSTALSSVVASYGGNQVQTMHRSQSTHESLWLQSGLLNSLPKAKSA